MRVVVTGGSGRAGRYIIPELLQHGYQVVSVDHVRYDYENVEFTFADLTDYGRTVSVLQGADAVVHMAAIPSPRFYTPEVVFSTNVLSTWNVLQAAEVLGISKLVLASSINAVGATWTGRIVAPQYFPLDEDHPTRAEDCYSLSKWVGEQMADGFARKRKVQMASFRFHGLWDDERLRMLKASPISDPYKWAEGFWGYVHIKDAARACRLALEADWTGHHAFFINAEDTMLNITTEEALSRCYPGVPLKKPLEGYASPLDCSKAKRMFGWEPLYSWRRV